MVDTATTKAVPAAPANASRQGYWRGVLRRLLRDPGGVFVGAIILVLLAPRCSGRGLSSKTLSNVDVPAPEAHRQRRLPLGSDELGRDMLSRLILGTRLSLFMGIVPVVFAFLSAAPLGSSLATWAAKSIP